MMNRKIGLLPRILLAIILGIGLGAFTPEIMVRMFVTFNLLFSEFLNFIIPLIILGLVAPSISDIGNSAGKILGATILLAYGATLFSGFLTYGVGESCFPFIIDANALTTDIGETSTLTPFFKVAIPAPLSVMTALVLAFTLGLGMAYLKTDYLKNACNDFKDIITKTIAKTIIPLLPIYIFGIFLNMTHTGQVYHIITAFVKIIAVLFVLSILLLIIQYTIAGIISKKNPYKLLKEMTPVYFTALGTQSSAATIPVTLHHTIKNGVSEDIANFVVPLCATIHLSGSTMKIAGGALALMMMQGIHYDFTMFAGFIFMLGITMVAAPGVPSGAIMAALGILSSILGFDENNQALMIALAIAMDSFGTACNVTGDGALALMVNKWFEKK